MKDIACPCGNNDGSKWDPRGYHIGGDGSEHQYVCGHCDSSAIEILRRGAGFKGIVEEDSVDVMFDWINETLTPFFRAKENSEGTVYMPPNLPRCVTGYYRNADKSYSRVNHAESAKVEIPPDPEKVDHDDLWHGLMDELGITASSREIPNQYFPDNGYFVLTRKNKPWYTCNIGGAKVTFGPRKRVMSITVEHSEAEFTELGKRAEDVDNTTFYFGSSGMTVHAWGRDKFVEYFKMVQKELLQA